MILIIAAEKGPDGEDDHIVDVAILVKNIGWIQDNPDFIEATCEGLLGPSRDMDYAFVGMLKDAGQLFNRMHNSHSDGDLSSI